MLLPPTELVLMAAAVALYLYDSATPLFSNEGILSPVGRDRWHVAFGSERFQWRGKDIYLPNPLAPHRPLCRLCWSPSGGNTPLASGWTPCRSFGLLAPLTWLMAFALFVLLPLGLFSRFGDLMIVATLVCFYFSALCALGYLWCYRERFQCSRRQFVHLVFESLTCPPFALNIIRHLSLAQTNTADLAWVARQLQRADDWDATRHVLIGRIENEISWAEDKPELVVQLRQHIIHLLNGLPVTEPKMETAQDKAVTVMNGEQIEIDQ